MSPQWLQHFVTSEVSSYQMLSLTEVHVDVAGMTAYKDIMWYLKFNFFISDSTNLLNTESTSARNAG